MYDPNPALVSRHPRLPGVELMHGPRSGESYLLAVGVRLDPDQLVDVGEWLAKQGREQAARRRR
ncbi:hypothetical protein FH608_046260 [Nonomuraea phyllanthi]|uniref:Uncharacterized protein n=1 Tax=Nonomuraea phyllanthi TaxID=2219224 RepID=A0A5C4V5X8_9ACTN|nr:hypothetical protein [Nonomuraea phyllanthi]KAB8186899.1 hypothetical protein FH608_046260 [Nonomuraea phyllanthi]